MDSKTMFRMRGNLLISPKTVPFFIAQRWAGQIWIMTFKILDFVTHCIGQQACKMIFLSLVWSRCV